MENLTSMVLSADTAGIVVGVKRPQYLAILVSAKSSGDDCFFANRVIFYRTSYFQTRFNRAIHVSTAQYMFQQIPRKP